MKVLLSIKQLNLQLLFKLQNANTFFLVFCKKNKPLFNFYSVLLNPKACTLGCKQSPH